MKKILAMVLAFTLVMSMNMIAFAETVQKPVDVEVYATYEANEDIRVTYSVDVEWTDLSFTYHEGDKAWDTTDHEYIQLSEGKWEESKAFITVTNHSNAAVSAVPEWTAYEPFTNVDMLFTGDDGSDINAGFPLVLDSAATNNEAVSGTIHVTPAGHLDESAIQTTNIGVITITINEMSDTIYVSNEEELRAAIAQGGNIELLNTITLSQPEGVIISKDVNLDLAENALIVVNEEFADVVFSVDAENDDILVTIQDGSIVNSYSYGIGNKETLYLNNVKVSAEMFGVENGGGILEVHGGEITGGELYALGNSKGGTVTSYNCIYSNRSANAGGNIQFPAIQNVDGSTIKVYGGHINSDSTAIAHIKYNTNEGSCTAHTEIYDAEIVGGNISGEARCAVDIRNGGYFHIENSVVNGSIYTDSSIAATVEVDEYTRNNMNGAIVDAAEQ